MPDRSDCGYKNRGALALASDAASGDLRRSAYEAPSVRFLATFRKLFDQRFISLDCRFWRVVGCAAKSVRRISRVSQGLGERRRKRRRLLRRR